jgi:hypothetical protein
MDGVVSWQLPLPSRDIPSIVDLSSGGRSSVHGWLWMPTDQHVKDNVTILEGFWSHHTPEFWMISPHVFQIIVKGVLHLDTPVSGLPFPPYVPLVGTEYTFTPPLDFSLNDLITGSLVHYTGNWWNGIC